MTMKENNVKNRLSSVYFNYQIAGYTREININYSNGYHFDVQYSFYPILVVFVSPTIEVTMTNNTFINSTGLNIFIAITYPRSLVLNQTYFKDLISMNYQIINILQYTYLNVVDLTWTNKDPINLKSVNFFLFIGASNSTLLMDKINVYNTTLIRNLFH